MSDVDLMDPTYGVEEAVEDMTKLEDGIITEVVALSKKDLTTPSVPLQDRWGRPRWVRTRICYCLDSKLDSCNIVKREVCPSQSFEKSLRTSGKWLYATNPDFNVPPPKDEVVESVTSDATTGNSDGSIVIS